MIIPRSIVETKQMLKDVKIDNETSILSSDLFQQIQSWNKYRSLAYGIKVLPCYSSSSIFPLFVPQLDLSLSNIEDPNLSHDR